MCTGAAWKYVAIGYTGSLSIEWEDAGMDRLVGAAAARQFVADPVGPPAAAFERRVCAFSAPTGSLRAAEGWCGAAGGTPGRP